MVDISKQVVIFDIDGVLSEPSKRLIYIKQEPKLWDKFYENCESDKPIGAGCSVAYSCVRELNIVKFLTGRPEKCRKATLEWLHEYISEDIRSEDLIMRENWNPVPDVSFKRKIGEEIGFDNILCVFEDKENIVNMWLENGVTCFKTKQGVKKRSDSIE